MGFFSSSDKETVKVTNKVWKSRSACVKGLVRECLLARKNKLVPILLTHFPDAFQELIAFLDASSIPYTRVNTFTGIDVWRSMNIAMVEGHADGEFIKHVPTSTPVIFYLFGRYPMLATEQTLLKDLTAPFPKASVVSCLSMEDPLMQAFVGDRMKPILESLGLGEDESIEHAMVDKALENALTKVGKQVVNETRASSEKDWFARNYPHQPS